VRGKSSSNAVKWSEVKARKSGGGGCREVYISVVKWSEVKVLVKCVCITSSRYGFLFLYSMVDSLLFLTLIHLH
jgi:hypothetical protein